MPTYDNAHAYDLNRCTKHVQSRQDLPSCLPLLLASTYDDDIRNDRHTLEYNGERHDESDGAPHGTEITVAMTVALIREGVAGMSEGGADSMKAVGVMDMFAAGLQAQFSH